MLPWKRNNNFPLYSRTTYVAVNNVKNVGSVAKEPNNNFPLYSRTTYVAVNNVKNVGSVATELNNNFPLYSRTTYVAVNNVKNVGSVAMETQQFVLFSAAEPFFRWQTIKKNLALQVKYATLLSEFNKSMISSTDCHKCAQYQVPYHEQPSNGSRVDTYGPTYRREESLLIINLTHNSFSCTFISILYMFRGSHVPIIRRINCINTTSGIWHCL